jgi:putative ABC transport system permease protein
LLKDIRYALRQFAQNPGFVTIAVLALALGIGANVCIFSFFNVYLLRPLPTLKDPDGLIMIYGERRGGIMSGTSHPDFLDLQKQSRSFASLLAVEDMSPALSGRNEPERVYGARVSSSFFDIFPAPPAVGRAFLPDEYAAGSEPVVVLSDGFWKRRFGGAAMLGESLVLDGVSYKVVGVMPPRFRFSWDDYDLFTPLVPGPAHAARGRRPLDVMARLKPGASIASARAELTTIARALEAQYPESNREIGFAARELVENVARGPRQSISILMYVVAFVLLIACSNVANLQLARATGRAGEIAIRVALGASRWRIIRQVLTESLLVSAAGGLLGLGLAMAGAKYLVSIVPPDIAPTNHDLLDPTLLGFTALIAVITGAVSGIAPAFQVSRVSVNDTLKEGGRSGSGGAKGKLRNALVVVEVTLAVVLLLAAGLLIRSFAALQNATPGFRVEGILAGNIRLPENRYAKPEMRTAFFRDLTERLAALPGVASAAAGNGLPLAGGANGNSFNVEGRPAAAPGQESVARTRSITPGYLQTMAIPLLRGRYFTEQDSETNLPVVMVNERLVQQYFPVTDPLGKRLRFGAGPSMTIVGVTGNVKQSNMLSPPFPEIYLPLRQSPVAGAWVVVRARNGDAGALAGAVRAEVRRLDSGLPVTSLRTMQEMLHDVMALPRLMTWLTTIFAGIALWMAAMGIYGVVSYSVAQRTRELGIRMALGAGGGRVLALVLRQAVWLVLTGIAIGVPAAAAVTRMLQTFLFGVGARDPLTFLTVPLVLAMVALLASYIPARRAARLDPVIALRCE